MPSFFARSRAIDFLFTPLAISVGKEVLCRDADQGYGHAIEAISFLFGTEDQAEGIAAFRERRSPKFEGR